MFISDEAAFTDLRIIKAAKTNKCNAKLAIVPLVVMIDTSCRQGKPVRRIQIKRFSKAASGH